VDKDTLLKPRLPEADVDIPGVGTVRVRGLSRYEVLLAQKEQPKGVVAYERVMLRFGMVDPALTEDEATQWQKASPAGELEPVTRQIAALSGMGEGADKAQYKSHGGGSGA
jgi:hypothetical protein